MRTVHRDHEQKPPAKALFALKRWLVADGRRPGSLAPILRTSHSQVTRLLAGTAYLSATQRRAVETFTNGAITAAMLERAPATAQPSQPRPMAMAKPLGPSAETVTDLAARVLVAALVMILDEIHGPIAEAASPTRSGRGGAQ